MTGRRSVRAAAKASVKYTSDSEASDFSVKNPKSSYKRPAPASKKGTKRAPSLDGEADKKPKRHKKSAETLAAEHSEKSKKQEEKAASQKSKQRWEDWLSGNDVAGKLLDAEPDREDCVTQTDAQKEYGLRANELTTLEHFEKPNQYGGQTKLFLTANIKKLAFRKYGLLAGLTEEEQILETGEEIWEKRHDTDARASFKKPTKEAAPKPKTPKQKWIAYVDEHSVGDVKLSEEPEDCINQTDCRTLYRLLPQDLVCLPHLPKLNPKYGNTTKLFNKADVQNLAYRKAATIAGLEETDTDEFLGEGKTLLAMAASEHVK